MAGGIAGIISDMRAREALKQRQTAMDQNASNAMLRALMIQNAIAQRQKTSPTATREQRLAQQFATRRADQQAQDKAWVTAFLSTPISDVPPEMRKQIEDYQRLIMQNPENMGPIAKALMGRLKPHGLQLKATVTTDDDPNSPTYGMPRTEYNVFDPNAAAMGSVSGSSTPPGAAAVMAPAVAPSSSRGTSGAADHFYNKHFGAGVP